MLVILTGHFALELRLFIQNHEVSLSQGTLLDVIRVSRHSCTCLNFFRSNGLSFGRHDSLQCEARRKRLIIDKSSEILALRIMNCFGDCSGRKQRKPVVDRKWIHINPILRRFAFEKYEICVHGRQLAGSNRKRKIALHAYSWPHFYCATANVNQATSVFGCR